MAINTIYAQHSIGCSCSDNISFGEKLVFNQLIQTGVNFEYHKTFNWSKNVQVDNPKLCGNKEYDFSFILNDEIYTIETHGKQLS